MSSDTIEAAPGQDQPGKLCHLTTRRPLPPGATRGKGRNAPPARRPPTRQDREIRTVTTLAGSVDSLYRTDEEKEFLAQRPTAIGSSEKKVMRVYINATQFKTVGILPGAFVYEVMQETRKKMRGEDTDEWGLYETKDGVEMRLLRESEIMDDITAFWTKGHQCLFKVRNPGDDPKEDLAKLPVRDGSGVFRGGGGHMMMGGLASAMKDALASRGGGPRGGMVRGRGMPPPSVGSSSSLNSPPSPSPSPSVGPGGPGFRGGRGGHDNPRPLSSEPGPPPTAVRRPPPIGRGMVGTRGSSSHIGGGSADPPEEPPRRPGSFDPRSQSSGSSPPPTRPHPVPTPSVSPPSPTPVSTPPVSAPPVRPPRPLSSYTDVPITPSSQPDPHEDSPTPPPKISPSRADSPSGVAPLNRSVSVAVVGGPKLSLLGRTPPSPSPLATADSSPTEQPKVRVKSVARIYTDATTFKTIPSFEDATVGETIVAVGKKMGGADTTNWGLYLNCNSSDIRLLRESEILVTCMKGFSDSKVVFKPRKAGDPGPEQPKPAATTPSLSSSPSSPSPVSSLPSGLPPGMRPTSMMISRTQSLQQVPTRGSDDHTRASPLSTDSPPVALRPKPSTLPVTTSEPPVVSPKPSFTRPSPPTALKPAATFIQPETVEIEPSPPKPEAPVAKAEAALPQIAPKPVFQKPVLQPKPSLGATAVTPVDLAPEEKPVEKPASPISVQSSTPVVDQQVTPVAIVHVTVASPVTPPASTPAPAQPPASTPAPAQPPASEPSTSAEPASSYATKRMKDWTIEDVVQWIKDLGFGDFAGGFEDNMIAGADLLELTQNELKSDLGISALGARKAILRKIDEEKARGD